MLTLQFVPHADIEGMHSGKRVRKLLNLVKEEKIVLLEGRLTKQEEAELIKKTMEEVDRKFKGIELGVIYPQQKHLDFFRKLKGALANILLKDRQGLTVIGPATIVKEIKQDPNKFELFTKTIRKKR